MGRWRIPSSRTYTIRTERRHQRNIPPRPHLASQSYALGASTLCPQRLTIPVSTLNPHLQPKSTILLTLSGLQIRHLGLEILKTIPSSPSTFHSELCSQQSFIVMGYWGKYWVGSRRRGWLEEGRMSPTSCWGFRIGVENWQ